MNTQTLYRLLRPTATSYRLLRPTAHATRWSALCTGAGLGLAVVLLPETLTDKLTGAQVADLLRIAAACVSLGVAFLLDDPAARSTPAVPTSRLVRNLARMAIAVPCLALWWGVTLGLARAHAHHGARPPAGALSLEFAALVATAVALAAIAQHAAPNGSAGVVAAPAMLVLAAAVWFLPRPVALVLAPSDPHWNPAHRRWTVILAIALVAFVWASHERVRHPRPPGRA
jgi:hypothetical protein